MTTVTSKVFKSGNSQAVRLPKEVAYEKDVEVTIIKTGDVLTIRPKKSSKLNPAELVALLRTLPSPGDIEVRDPDIFPDRPGL